MQATLQRRTVVQDLLDEPYRFQFFQAVRLLVEWLGQQGIAPERALTDHLFFENNLSLSFASSQIARLVSEAGQSAAEIRITPAFMGFLGANGTLPHHYTEQFAAYLAATKDAAPRAFLDMFSNRTLAQFYKAWCKHRVEYAGDDGADGFLPLLLSLAGFQRDAGKTVDGTIDVETIAHYAGVTLQRPVPPDVLSRVLSDYLAVPLAIDESIGCWIDLLEHEQCALGGLHATLGNDTLLGDRSWRPDLRARIRIGPLNRNDFDRLLPGSEGARAGAHAAPVR
jgi:type VI secretion system protein ImpH